MKLCNANGDECKTCSGENCNNEFSFRKCIDCSSIYHPNCGESPMTTNTVTCSNYNDECFTYFGKVELLRGCLNDQKPEDIKKILKGKYKYKSKTCKTQFGTCNNDPIKLEMCNECSTKNGDDCLNNPDMYKDRVCNEINVVDVQGCYAEYNVSERVFNRNS